MSSGAARPSMDRGEVVDVVRKVLSNLVELDLEDIKESTRLEEDLGADSLLNFEVLEDLKDEFKLDLDFHLLSKYTTKYRIATVGDLADLVLKYMERGEAMFEDPQGGPAPAAR
ncbi:MAG TPA: acyl carrier protein [Candidatus Polarisedimenticolia bacterium]|nr:acyl carrier protein [Candidatus Polarisedimenticolia bacterium]